MQFKLLFVLLLVFCHMLDSSENDVLLEKRKTHKCKTMRSGVVKQLSDEYNEIRFKNFLLKPMLRERVAGTEGNRFVQAHIREMLDIEGWSIEEDIFVDYAPQPYGAINFTNIIATYNADAPRKLVLACHHDSKLMNRFKFIGATDSAVPCAMLLELAVTLTPKLQNRRTGEELGLQLIFFDGEEAFVRWQRDDSLYGSRHYANKLLTVKRNIYREVTVDGLQQMDLLVLLDLIGAKGAKFYDWFPHDTGQAFDRLKNIEKRLKNQKLIGGSYFSSSPAPGAGIQDDHIPFQEKYVPCLHLIVYPFPSVWHSAQDDESALDYNEIKELIIILKVFVCEYMHC